MHNPFARKRPNPKRTEPRRTGDRVRLKGEAMTRLRAICSTKARERCETCGAYAPFSTVPHEDFAGKMVYPGELSHKRHGANKSDTPEECLWECRECHRKRHNAGGKPVPRKAGRPMNQKEAVTYWKGTKCWCGKEEKASGYSFGPTCWAKLSPQSQYDLLNTLGEDYIQAIALAEIEVLVWKPAEEKECSPTIAETK